jgi:hypothetical protein
MLQESIFRYSPIRGSNLALAYCQDRLTVFPFFLLTSEQKFEDTVVF